MSVDNRNEPGSDRQQQSGPQQSQTSGAGQQRGTEEENPQQGDQWDNYQTRTLSSEGEPDIKESDLLSADEASKQQPQHRED